MDDSNALAMAVPAGMGEFDDSVPLRSITNDDDEEEGLAGSALNLNQAMGDRVPPFLSKLYQIVTQPNTDHCVRWSPAGDSFVVVDHHVFSKQVLPQFFKHSSLCSFIRQLNTYGFRKRTNMGSSSDQMEFFNENFRKGHVDILSRIKRTGQSKNAVRSPNSAPPRPITGAAPAAPGTGGLQLKAGSNALHATKSDLMHVQGQVNALISEVRDMRTLMHQYMLEVDKRVSLFSMEMQGAAAPWYNGGMQQQNGQAALAGAAGAYAGAPGAGSTPLSGQHGAPATSVPAGQPAIDPATAASLAAMVSQAAPNA